MDNKITNISVVMASFNQAKFLEEAIISVLSQGYPNLEYIIVDGGSTDESIDIIKKYAHRLSYWISERDGGLEQVLNKGFSRATGDIMAWINADNKYWPNVFFMVNDVFKKFSEVEWLTSNCKVYWDKFGRPVKTGMFYSFGRAGYRHGLHLPCSRYGISQEATFWKRSLWLKAGAHVKEGLLASDFELWSRFWECAEISTICAPIGGISIYPKQITGCFHAQCVLQAKDIWATQKWLGPFFVRNIICAVVSRLPRQLLAMIYETKIIRYKPFTGGLRVIKVGILFYLRIICIDLLNVTKSYKNKVNLTD